MAVPGLGPPIFDGRDVLVDGGVLNNLPIDIMSGLGRGPVFACSVSGSVGPVLDHDYAEIPSPWRVLWSRIAPFGARMRVPSIASILIRSSSLSNATIRARGYPGTDLVFEPPIDGHKLLDWQSIDQLEEVGYRYARARIEAWKHAGGVAAPGSGR
jgi:predicted acylesterase/phospholipase RssA